MRRYTKPAAVVTALGALSLGVARMVTRPRHASIGELWIMPTEEA
ncbi:hypothetical protein [Streptomyces botrytidirepellens]|nr:hypothetical protein [Streptomyces botrytidirepellens]